MSLAAVCCLLPGRLIAQQTVGEFVGQNRFDNQLQMTLHWVGGAFRMGSPESEAGRFHDEDAVDVTVSAFWIGAFEVSQAQYEALMGTNPSKRTGPSLPVVDVNWRAATRFCEQLSEKETEAGRLAAGWEYRLPTEAQWECACRAGTTTRFSFGDDETLAEDYVWHLRNSGGRSQGIGVKKPNAWGIYDMHGNVAEWCRDTYEHDLPGGTDPEIRKRGSSKVYRGGSTDGNLKDCRSASRNSHSDAQSSASIGFRVVLTRPAGAPKRSTEPVDLFGE